MFTWKKISIAALMLSCSAPLMAQSDAELQEQMRAAEAQLEESVRQMQEAENLEGAESEEAERMMYEAERQLAEAARQIADLSYQRLPNMRGVARIDLVGSDRPVLGVNIGGNDSSSPVEGVAIAGVSPGGAAAEAGLRSADIITAINGQSLSASSGSEAVENLLDFMKGVENGDELDVDYLRNSKVATTEVTPRAMAARTYAFRGPAFDVHVAPDGPIAPMPRSIAFVSAGGWADMELVPLTENLGRYFGADDGLLVVRAPQDEALQLQDGDVIQSIGGRTPSSVSHAMRILGSYQTGETLEIDIMRDKRKRTLDIEMPDQRAGQHFNFTAPHSAIRQIEVLPAVPAAPPAPDPDHQ